MSALAWILLGCLVFAIAVAYDWAYARYVTAASRGRATEAACWSALTAGFGLVGFLSITSVSAWLAAPEIAGFFVGTYLGVRRKAPEPSRLPELPEARVVR